MGEFMYDRKMVGGDEVYTRKPQPDKKGYVRSHDPDEDRSRTKSNWSFIQMNERAIDRWCKENKTTRTECGMSSAEILKRVG